MDCVTVKQRRTWNNCRVSLCNAKALLRAHAIFRYDVTDRETFKHVEIWLKDIEHYANENSVVFLVGNKCDEESKRQVSHAEAEVSRDILFSL
jgi:hypothetical protein